MSVSTVFTFVQYIGFISTELLNALLIWLILTKANKKIGSYKNLMLSFAIYSMVYGVVEFSTQPIIYSKGTIFVMIVDTIFQQFNQFSIILLCAYIGSFGLCINFLASHFFYRYLAVCRTSALSYFEGYRFVILFIPGAIMGIAWTTIGYICMYPSDFKASLLNDTIMEIYGINIYEAPHISLLYYLIDDDGNIQVYRDCIIFIYAFSVMNLCLSTMVFCGTKCYKALGGVANMSKRTKDLNKQLFLTLVVQTLVPVCTMFIPVSVLFVLPIFSIDLGTWANMPVIDASLYPALDALIVICMIRDFRETVTCKSRKRRIHFTATSSDGKFNESSFR